MTKPIAKTIEMTKAQWKAWDKHLRSGEIQQARSDMCDPHGKMCCLGVLEYALEGTVVDAENGFPSLYFLKKHNITFLNEDKSKPLPENSPYLTGGYAHELTDDVGLSFKQIAARIKSRVKFIPAKRKD